MPDGYTLICFGVNDAASIHVNEEMVAAKEIRPSIRRLTSASTKDQLNFRKPKFNGMVRLPQVSIALPFAAIKGSDLCMRRS